jgi:hypothetical protein
MGEKWLYNTGPLLELDIPNPRNHCPVQSWNLPPLYGPILRRCNCVIRVITYRSQKCYVSFILKHVHDLANKKEPDARRN